MPRILNICLLLLTGLLTAGCATIEGPTDPQDPFESYNRAMHQFNDKVDQYVLKPVAKGYDTITPAPVQKGVSNFFSNLDDVLVMINDLFQLKFKQFASDTGRFVVNSTLGIFGLIDWASDMGLEKHNEDFGQTLGYWGVPSGPYFVLPFWGPSTIRDTGGLVVDSYEFDPLYNELHEGFPIPARDGEAAWTLTAIKAVDTRAQLLKAEKILDEAALDRYIFIREAFLQRRQNLVYDGYPPEEESEVFSEEELFSD